MSQSLRRTCAQRLCAIVILGFAVIAGAEEAAPEVEPAVVLTTPKMESSAGPAPAPLSDTEILSAADRSRGNTEGITWTVSLESMGEDSRREMILEVKSRGFDVYAETISPINNRGDKVIMLNGNMWFHKPGLSKPIPISRRQKLLGDAAYGDIAATNHAGDYSSTRLEDEEVDGEICYVFDLKSINARTTYDAIRYWVSRSRLVGVKAEYFTKSGKLFKSARMSYGHVVEIGGEMRPFLSEIVIRDRLIGNDQTRLKLTDPVIGELPDSLFNLNLLR